MFLAVPQCGCCDVPSVLLRGGKGSGDSRRKADSAPRLGAGKTLGEVAGAMIHHVSVTQTRIFLSRE